MIIGRKQEQERIKRLLNSGRSEFLALTGRRRVGDGTVAVVHAIRRTADGRFALEEQDAPPE